MSERPDDGPDETLIRGDTDQSPDADADETVVRRREPPVLQTQVDADETVVRGQTARRDANDDATVIRRAAPRREPDAAAEATVVRGDTRTGNAEATIVRGGSPATEAGDDDATIIRGSTDDVSGDQDAATVLRGGDTATHADDCDATIIRGAEPPLHGNATVVRGSDADSDATIIRGTDAPTGDAGAPATVLRGGAEATVLRGPVDGDATIIRAGDPANAPTNVRGGDEDATIMNIATDDDSTVLGAGSRGDSTQWKSEGRPVEPRGNTEAGRLLKNRFVLEEKVGSGGMGDVYKALDLRAQEAREKNPYVAIKILNESFSRHKDAFISLQREASKTRQIPHTNIMGVYDFDKDGDTVYMSMELLDGEPLDDYLKGHPEGVSIDDAFTIIDGICQGLSRAHGANIVHSDFKPGNIYYTKDKIAKVFDFGIARAVKSDVEADGEKTVFDAGSLGALTPAYASLEMLRGEEPMKADDVYAVALVAYELFTGKHPFNKTPADKALERGLKPEPIKFIKRRQWRALRDALSLEGKDRIQTIDEFHDRMFRKDPPYLAYTGIAATILALAGFAGYQYLNPETVDQEFVQAEQRMEIMDGSLAQRLSDLRFDDENWRTGVKEDLFKIQQQELEINERWPDHERSVTIDIEARKSEVLDAYLLRIDNLINEARDLGRASQEEVGNALRRLTDAALYLEEVNTSYRFDVERIDRIGRDLATNQELRTGQLDVLVAEASAEQQRIEAEEEARRIAEAQQAEDQRRLDFYNDGLEDFTGPLRECRRTGQMSNADLDRIAATMTGLGGGANGTPERFARDRPGMIRALAGCTNTVAVKKPDEARRIKAKLISLFPGDQVFRDISIVDLDVCARARMAGNGGQKRARCSDKLVEGGKGPELVVIPADGNGIPKFAMSQTEIRIGDWNAFCDKTGCSKLPGSSSLPATNLDVNSVRSYLDWLTDQSGRTYRLPTRTEWYYAATAAGTDGVDANVNCTVQTLGFKGGESLSNVQVGRPNKWGLYNHIGNARELAIDGESLVAMGGAHIDPKETCTAENQVTHSGGADAVTGFRVVRQISG